VFCDIFASALLVPPADIERLPPAPKSLIGLADQFDVSIQVAARAFIRCNQGISIWGLRGLPETGGGANLSILWSAGPLRLSSGTHLASRLSTLPAVSCDDEQEIDFDNGMQTYRVKLARLSKTYFVGTPCSL
jgi:hypothetical protein